MNNTTVNEIINRFNSFLAKTNQKLPSRGILAGQSLATIYMDIVGFDKYKTNIDKKPINDVDIFVQTTKTSNRGLMRKVGDAKVDYIGHYGRFLGTYAQEKYSVIATRHIKNLNLTYFNCSARYKSPMDLISLFDINCTQIALDLETKELYMSEYFKEFIKTGELKVVDLTTSIHTIIRVAKKAQEFGFYCNIEKEFAKLSVNINLKYFADGYYKNYLKCKDIIDEYFTLKSVSPKTEWDYANSNFKFDILYTLELKEGKFKEYKIFHDIVGSYTSESIMRTSDMFFGSNENKREEIKSQFRNTKDAAWYFLGKFYFKGCSEKNFKSILKVLKQHPRLTTIYYSSANTYEKLVEFHNNLTMLIREKGEMIFGILENTTIDIPCEYDKLKDFIEKEIEQNSGELIKPTIDDFKFSHWEFREIITSLGLFSEGARNHHCVGGYSSSVKNGSSKILSLSTSNAFEKNYTIELRHFGDNKYYMSQCMAKFNVPANESLANTFAREIQKHTKLEVFSLSDYREYRERENEKKLIIANNCVEEDIDIPF